MEIRVGLSVPDNKTSPRDLCSIQNKNSPGTVVCVKNSNRMQCRRVERALGYRSRDAVLMFQHERVGAINGEPPPPPSLPDFAGRKLIITLEVN